MQLRERVLVAARRVVVKVGTQLIATPCPPPLPGEHEGEGGCGLALDADFVAGIAAGIAALTARGVEVTLVSSGAVGAGCVELGLANRPADVADLQAVAAIGQRRLMTLWHEALAAHGLRAGQVLLTRDDFDDRGRFLNIRNCLRRLHAFGAVPILNENDTVAVDEIRFGDNDLLAAMTCTALPADALILLTSVPGLLDAQGRVVELVERASDVVALAEAGAAAAGAVRTALGSGGMSSKVTAARMVTGAGELVVIASGREDRVLERIMAGERLGTVFHPADRRLGVKKRWIGLTTTPAGQLYLDDGAVKAILRHGRSLLASGIFQCTGDFQAGDVLSICNVVGEEFARGQSNYSAFDLQQIIGHRSDEFGSILGRAAYDTVIHRDNLVLI